MTVEEAEKLFWRALQIDCPDCDAKAKKLCDTPGVWVHLGRVLATENQIVNR